MTEIYDVTDADTDAVQSPMERDVNKQLEFDNDWSAELICRQRSVFILVSHLDTREVTHKCVQGPNYRYFFCNVINYRYVNDKKVTIIITVLILQLTLHSYQK